MKQPKTKPKLKKKTQIGQQQTRIAMLERHIKSQTKRINGLKEKLHYAEKVRNALAKLVDPRAVALIHTLRERNVNLELALVLTRQMARTIRWSWEQQGYPVDAVDAFEADLNRILDPQRPTVDESSN